jgi:hypothetical protein
MKQQLYILLPEGFVIAKESDIDSAASPQMRQSLENLKVANRNGQALLDAAILVLSIDPFIDGHEVLQAAIDLCDKSAKGEG